MTRMSAKTLPCGSAAIIGVSLLFHSLFKAISDGDSFYHIRHAWLYRTEGLLQSVFPWVQYSVINRFSADIWYGFHILIIPISYFEDLVVGIEFGAFLTTVLSASLFFFALLRLRLKWPVAWLLLFLFASADLAYRLTMFRPHPLSLGLTMLLFSYLPQSDDDGAGNGRSLLPVFLISAVLSWIHLALSWLPILMVLVVGGVQVLQRRPPELKKALAVVGGLIAGWLSRPNPLGAMRIAYVQVAQLLLEKNLPLQFGRELIPYSWENLVDQLIPICLFSLMGIGFLVWLIARRRYRELPVHARTAVWSSLILAAGFFCLTFSTARRSSDIFIGFAVLFLASLSTHPPIRHRPKRPWYFAPLASIAIIASIYMPIKTIYRFSTYEKNSFSPDYLKGAALWLKENARPREIVFNVHWDRFGELFFWNPQNYYVNGMDPIFQYAYDPSLYWKTHFLAINEASAFTCGRIRCLKSQTEDTHTVLKQDFGASYVVVEKGRSVELYGYLERSGEFTEVFEDQRTAVFRIN